MTQGVYRYQLSIQIDTKAGDGICNMKCLLKESQALAWAQESTYWIAYRAYTLTYVQHTHAHEST